MRKILETFTVFCTSKRVIRPRPKCAWWFKTKYRSLCRTQQWQGLFYFQGFGTDPYWLRQKPGKRRSCEWQAFRFSSPAGVFFQTNWPVVQNPVWYWCELRAMFVTAEKQVEGRGG